MTGCYDSAPIIAKSLMLNRVVSNRLYDTPIFIIQVSGHAVEVGPTHTKRRYIKLQVIVSVVRIVACSNGADIPLAL
jgi:hypothetical protein